MTAPDPAAYESLERRLDTVLGPDDAGTLRIVLASLATKDDLNREVAALKDDVALLQLDLADFKKDVRHEFDCVREEFVQLRTEMHGMKHEIIGALRGEINAAITSQTKPLLIAIVGVAVVVASAVLTAVQLG